MTQKNLILSEERPFLGLNSYEEDHHQIFGGRDTEVMELFQMVEKKNVTVVFGKSGIGKTSLLQAGLVPRLKRYYYLPVIMKICFKDDLSPLEQMRLAIETEIKKVDPSFKSPGEFSLWEYIHRVKIFDGIVIPVLILDQFEEIFLADESQKSKIDTFLMEIANIAENRVPLEVQEKEMEYQAREKDGQEQETMFSSGVMEQNYRVVLSLREDYLPQLENLNHLMPSIKKNRYRVLPLTGENAKEAILKTGRNLVNSETAQKIIEKMNPYEQGDYVPFEGGMDTWKEKKIDPLLLSLYCEKLNNVRIENKAKTIDAKLLKALSENTMLKNIYEENVTEPEHRKIIEESLLTQEGYRDLKQMADLKLDEADIQNLQNKKIIRRITFGNRQYVQLVHDSLARIIREERDKRRESEDRIERKRALKQAIKIRRNRRLWGLAVLVVILLAGMAFMLYRSYSRAQNYLGLAHLKLGELSASEDDFNSARLFALHALKELKKVERRAEAKGNLLKYPGFSVILAKQFDHRIDCAIKTSNGKILAGGIKEGKPVLMDVKNEKSIALSGPEPGKISNMKFVPGGKIFAAYGNDNKIRLWDTTTGELIDIIIENSNAIGSIAFNPDGSILAYSYRDNRIKLWDIFSKKEIISFASTVKKIHDMSFHPDGKMLAVIGERVDIEKSVAKMKIVIHSMESGENLMSLVVDFLKEFKYLRYVGKGPNKNTLALYGFDGIVFLDLTVEEKTGSFVQVPLPVNALDFSPSGYQFITSSKTNGLVKIWKWSEKFRLPQSIVQLKIGDIDKVYFNPEGSEMLTICKNKVMLWNLKSYNCSILPIEHTGQVSGVAISPDGHTVASAFRAKEKNIFLWDSRTGQKKSELSGHNELITTLKFSPKGDTLASGSKNCEVKLWDPKKKSCTSTFNFHEKEVNAIAYSNDGRKLATAGLDKTILITDIRKGEILTRIDRHSRSVQCLAFSPDDRLLASGSWDSEVKVWDADSGSLENNFPDHSKLITEVCFTPDGTKVVSASLDETIRVWDIKKNKLSYVIRASGPVYCLDISVDNIIAASGLDPVVKLWNIGTGHLIASLKGHEYAVRCLDFSNDGKLLVSGSDDKTIRFWELSYLSNKDPITTQIEEASENYKLTLDMEEVETRSKI